MNSIFIIVVVEKKDFGELIQDFPQLRGSNVNKYLVSARHLDLVLEV